MYLGKNYSPNFRSATVKTGFACRKEDILDFEFHYCFLTGFTGFRNRWRPITIRKFSKLGAFHPQNKQRTLGQPSDRDYVQRPLESCSFCMKIDCFRMICIFQLKGMRFLLVHPNCNYSVSVNDAGSHFCMTHRFYSNRYLE